MYVVAMTESNFLSYALTAFETDTSHNHLRHQSFVIRDARARPDAHDYFVIFPAVRSPTFVLGAPTVLNAPANPWTKPDGVPSDSGLEPGAEGLTSRASITTAAGSSLLPRRSLYKSPSYLSINLVVLRGNHGKTTTKDQSPHYSKEAPTTVGKRLTNVIRTLHNVSENLTRDSLVESVSFFLAGKNLLSLSILLVGAYMIPPDLNVHIETLLNTPLNMQATFRLVRTTRAVHCLCSLSAFLLSLHSVSVVMAAPLAVNSPSTGNVQLPRIEARTRSSYDPGDLYLARLGKVTYNDWLYWKLQLGHKILLIPYPNPPLPHTLNQWKFKSQEVTPAPSLSKAIQLGTFKDALDQNALVEKSTRLPPGVTFIQASENPNPWELYHQYKHLHPTAFWTTYHHIPEKWMDVLESERQLEAERKEKLEAEQKLEAVKEDPETLERFAEIWWLSIHMSLKNYIDCLWRTKLREYNKED
ncbi:hypothetical protein C8R42DRAFT_642570 [Lentinula raphanica]|nr:hypothetical protein C8R42DRAFT_642570 [Lentinula raphanica]